MRRITLLAALAVLVVPTALAKSSFPATISLPNGFQPEGIAVGTGSTFYVGSIPTGAVYTGDLRTVAGAPITSDVTCQRTAPRPEDYGVTFTTEQWARLLAVFAAGVCDYSRPGIGQVPLDATWQSYD